MKQYKLTYRSIGFLCAAVLIGLTSANLQIQTNIQNAVQTIKKIFVTSDGLAPDGTNEYVILNENGSGSVYFKNHVGIGATGTDANLIVSGDVKLLNTDVDVTIDSILGVDDNGNIRKTTIDALSGGTPFDGDREVTRNGVPNINVGGTTLQQFIENYFFPEIGPQVSISTSSPREKTSTSPTTTTTSVSRSVTRKSNPIDVITIEGTNNVTSIDTGDYIESGLGTTSIVINTGGLPSDGSSKNGSFTATITKNATNKFKITVSDTEGKSKVDTVSIARYDRAYYGKYTGDDIDSIDVTALSNSQLTNNDTLGTKSFAGNGYIYIAIPTALGSLSNGFTVNGLFNNNFETTTRSVTSNGYTQDYYIYRLRDFSTATLSVEIN